MASFAISADLQMLLRVMMVAVVLGHEIQHLRPALHAALLSLADSVGPLVIPTGCLTRRLIAVRAIAEKTDHHQQNSARPLTNSTTTTPRAGGGPLCRHRYLLCHPRLVLQGSREQARPVAMFFLHQRVRRLGGGAGRGRGHRRCFRGPRRRPRSAAPSASMEQPGPDAADSESAAAQQSFEHARQALLLGPKPG